MNKYSFETLFDDSNTQFKQIIIPKIQRDYVQGSGEYIEKTPIINSKGKRFIDALFDFIASNKNEFVLDFIYGSIKNSSFYPLDGQQRLTTLFLLYWYAAKEMAGGESKSRYFSFLKRFSYETRTSSRDFCKLLCSIENVKDDSILLSDYIKGLVKYHKSYELDPTIKAMLIMLDIIDCKYKELKSKNPSIRLNIRLRRVKFYLLPLDNFNLDEELYVKMNARGKVLTDYENFKADFISWLKSETNPFRDKLAETGHFDRPLYLSIASSLDNEWSDVVFKKHKDDFDLSFFKLISRWFISYYLTTTDFSSMSNADILKDPIISELSTFYNNVSNENLYTKFDSFKKILESIVDGEALWEFVNFLKNISSASFVMENIHPSWSSEVLDLADSKSSTQSDISVFAGISLFLNKVNAVDEELYNRWVRFIFNSVRGYDIDSWKPAVSVIKDLTKIASDSVDMDIDRFFASVDVGVIGTFVKSIAHEYKKHTFVAQDESWRHLFVTAEQNPFLRNDLNVLMSDDMSIDTFTNRLRNLQYLFDNKGLNQTLLDNYRHIICRAAIKNQPYNGLINAFFFDQDDKEEHLKKTLSAETGFTKRIRYYLDLENREAIISALLQDTDGYSPMNLNGLGLTAILESRIKSAHKNLFSSETLYQELFSEEMLYILIDSDHVCARFAYGNRKSKIIEIDSNRYQLFDALTRNGYKCKNTVLSCNNQKFYYGREIEFLKHSNRLDKDVVILFSLDGTIKIKDVDLVEISTLSIDYYNCSAQDCLTALSAEIGE